MKSTALKITTSWDDGHPLDLRVAELLGKHGLQGTFYIPLENSETSRPTLTARQIRDISDIFEVGAHTVHHTDLTKLSNDRARAEIFESKSRLEQMTGRGCRVFCFPKGRYARAHLGMAAEAGFAAVRTVEMMSLDSPRTISGLAVIPTTVQAHSHSHFAYLINAVKRHNVQNVWNLIRFANNRNWASMAISLCNYARKYGGVFHLWGHSWEIDDAQQWDVLDAVFAALSALKGQGSCVTNLELLCNTGQTG